MSSQRNPPTKLFTRDFVLASVVNLFISMVFYLLVTSMALYAVERFQASDSAAGLASSSFIIGSVAARLIAGKLLALCGRKPLLIASLAVFVLVSVLYIPADSLWLLLLLRFVHGMAFGAGNTALATAVQALIPPARRSEGTGYFGLSTTLSTATSRCCRRGLGLQRQLLRRILLLRGFLGNGAADRDPAAPTQTSRSPGTPAVGPRRGSFLPLDHRPATAVSLVILVCGVASSGMVSIPGPFLLSRSMPAAASWFFLLYAVTVLSPGSSPGGSRTDTATTRSCIRCWRSSPSAWPCWR